MKDLRESDVEVEVRLSPADPGAGLRSAMGGFISQLMQWGRRTGSEAAVREATIRALRKVAADLDGR